MIIPERFQVVDHRLACAVLEIVHGGLLRWIETVIEIESKKGVYIRGFQLLTMFHEWYRTSSVAGSKFRYSDLICVELRGDDLRRFQSDWDYVVGGQEVSVPESTLQYLYEDQIRKSRKMDATPCICH